MTTVNTGVQPTAGLPPASQASLASADFNMFLKLLTTQMQNQDPLDPMDTSEYTQQLVQYSQVEQSMQQTGALRDILSRLSAAEMAQASGFIGREAEFDTNVAGLSAKPAEWAYSLPREATSITAVIADETGRTVATKVLEAGKDGRFVWDGALQPSGAAPHGLYSLALKAVDASGNSIPANVRSVGVVDSVTSASGSVMIGVNGAQIPASALIGVATRREP